MASIAPPVPGLQRSHPAPDPVEPAWSQGVGIGLIGVLIAAFVISGWWRFTAPFGDNHDGSNGGFWVDVARDMTERGPIASRMGSRVFSGGIYAHHPPLIAWVTGVADWIGRDHTFVYRLPVILGSLVTIGLLVRLLRDLGLQWLAIGTGVGLALGTPLFFVYGPMIDTLPLSLPIGVALLVLWQRRVRHLHPTVSLGQTGEAAPARRPRGAAAGWLLGLVAALCVLSSWEAALLAGVACLASMILGRRDPAVLRHQVPMFVGAAIGLVVLIAWLLWATGSFGPLLDQLRTRSGTGNADVGFGDSLRQQWVNLGNVLGLVRWLLLPAALVGLWNPRTRLVMLVLVPTAVVYPLVLREAAYHDFWNLWFVAPLAIGVAATVDWVATHIRTSTARLALAAAGCVLVAASIGFTDFDDPSPSHQFRLGLGAAHALDAAPPPPDSPVLYLVLPRGFNDNWIALRTGAQLHSIVKPAALITALYQHPEAPVLLDCAALGTSYRRACRKRSPDPHGEPGSAYAVVPTRWINQRH